MRVRFLIPIIIGVMLLVVGLSASLYFAFVPNASTTVPIGANSSREKIAAEPMTSTSKEEAMGGRPAATPAATVTVPGPEREGPERVPTGFPHSPEGAIGQLAAIVQTVLQRMDMDATRAVFRSWAIDPTEQWPLMSSVQSFLDSARMTTLENGAIVTATPAAAQVKGTDGSDWVVVCVLMDVRAQYRRSTRIGYGYCEKMQWDNGRWMIAPGPPPASAPSVWPGTDKAREAGWLTWKDEA